jgi:hypothetical protein
MKRNITWLAYCSGGQARETTITWIWISDGLNKKCLGLHNYGHLENGHFETRERNRRTVITSILEKSI